MRLGKYNQLAIGKIAPDIVLPDLDGRMVSLSDVKKPFKLVLFWASWCPHCMEILPKLNRWYNQQTNKQVEIYSISLDFNREELSRALIEQPVSWPVFSEYKGWKTTAAIDYNVYATPTMFLLDRNRKILARPVSVSDLRNALLK